MRRIDIRARQRGLGLVELMIAITLSLVLSLAVIQVFLSTKTNYRLQDTVGTIQENGRFAMTYLAEDIRMAGFVGCSTVEKVALKNSVSGLSTVPATAFDPNSVAFWPTSIINGIDNVSAADTTLTGWGVKGGTDVLIVRHAVSGGASLTSVMASTSSPIAVKANQFNLKTGDVIMISDCSNADILKVTDISGANGSAQTLLHATTGNTAGTLGRAYGSDAEVLALQTATYYIAASASGRTTAGGTPYQSLWVAIRTTGQGGVADLKTGYKAELVEGVEDMQIKYGVDTDADTDHIVNRADTYMSAKEVSDAARWPSVVSVRINLLLAGTDGSDVPNDGTKQTYTFNGSAPQYSPDDRRLRKEFYSVVSIRNRSL